MIVAISTTLMPLSGASVGACIVGFGLGVACHLWTKSSFSRALGPGCPGVLVRRASGPS